MEKKSRATRTTKRVAMVVCGLAAIGLAISFDQMWNGRLIAAEPGATTMRGCSVPELSAFNIPNVTIRSATEVAASGLDPAYCDVIGSVATDGEGAGPGEATFRAKLPANWNHKYLASGPGGQAGSLDPTMNLVDFAAAVRKGYAFVTTDSGHQSSPLDASWALIAPGVPNKPAVIDYFYRAQHQVAVATKELVESFYGAVSIERSYFDGCSNAGRQALMEAMRYPDDYDGIIAGAPLLDRSGTAIGSYKNVKAFLNAFIPSAALPAIDAAVRANCDEADGVLDGLIQNPAACSFDPDSLVPTTLTQAQADALKVFMRAVRDDYGRLLYPGPPVSDLSAPGGFVPWSESVPPVDPFSAQPWGVAAPIAWRLADGNIRYFAMRDPNFNTNLDWPETDGIVAAEAARLFERRTRLSDTDRPEKLIPYLRRGGKVLLYHGYSDPALSPYRTVSFYQDLAELFGGYRNVQEHARLFMAPGQLHCGGGPGPNSFDTLTALENWVEHGVAPEAIIATKYVNDNPSLGIRRTMPLCQFPEQASYDGLGDPLVAASWTCSPRDRSLLEVGPNGVEAGLSRRHRERERRN
jgi:feruloyl esterase